MQHDVLLVATCPKHLQHSMLFVASFPKHLQHNILLLTWKAAATYSSSACCKWNVIGKCCNSGHIRCRLIAEFDYAINLYALHSATCKRHRTSSKA